MQLLERSRGGHACLAGLAELVHALFQIGEDLRGPCAEKRRSHEYGLCGLRRNHRLAAGIGKELAAASEEVMFALRKALNVGSIWLF